MASSFTIISILVLIVATVSSNTVREGDKYHVASNRNHSGNDSHHGEEEHEGIEVAGLKFENVRSPLVFTIVILLAGLSKVGFHHADFLSSKVPESCLLIIVGVILGAIINFSGAVQHVPDFFTPHTFFQFLLPPIILEASFSLHDRTFADNLGSVLLFAVVGTIFACFTIGLTLYGLAVAGAMGPMSGDLTLVQLLVFTALIVAVDPVAVLAVFQEIGVNDCLYFLVFGESLLNDGVTVVLYQVMQTYNRLDTIGADQIALGIVKFFVVCFGGLALGILAGIMTAVITKFTTHVKVVQPLVIYAMAYLGFLLAELFEFSGIISIIGCGLTQVQYAFHNISPKSKTTVKYFTKVISTSNEIIIFLFLGIALVREHQWHTGFVLWTVFLCLLYRFLITFALSFLINKLDKYRVRKIGYDEQFMIAYGGLRGAVAFSLVMLLNEREIPMKHMFVTTTLVVVMFTVFIQGVSIKPLVKLLQIQLAPEKELSMYRELANHVTDHMMAGMEDVVGFKGKYSIKEKLENFEDKYVRHWLQVEPERSDSELQAFYNKIVLKEHFKYLKVCGAKAMPDDVNIPRIDTNMYLNRLDQKAQPEEGEEEEEENILPTDEDTEPVVRRRKKVVGDIDARGLRHLLQSQRTSRMLLHSKYDKNITTESKSNFRSQIQRKTARNRRLQRMMSTSSEAALERTKSWSEQQAEICETRKDHTDPGKRAQRSLTLDMGSKSKNVTIQEPPMLDAVFEEDEEKAMRTEKKPLLHKDDSLGGFGAGSSPSARRAHGMERQLAMDEVPMKNLRTNSST